MLEVSERAVELCREQPGVQRLEALGTVIRLEYVGDIRGIPKIHKVLLDEGIPVLYFREVPANLEEVFMKVTKGEVA